MFSASFIPVDGALASKSYEKSSRINVVTKHSSHITNLANSKQHCVSKREIFLHDSHSLDESLADLVMAVRLLLLPIRQGHGRCGQDGQHHILSDATTHIRFSAAKVLSNISAVLFISNVP